MTKKLCDSMLDAAKEGRLFDWLYSHAEELSKDEALLIARELAYACSQPFDPNDRFTRAEIADTFENEIADYYSTWGFDE